MIQFFSEINYWVFDRESQMSDNVGQFHLSQMIPDNYNQVKQLLFCLRKTCSRSLTVLLSPLFVTLFIIFGEVILQKLVKNQLFELNFRDVQQNIFHAQHELELNFIKNSALYTTMDIQALWNHN